MSKVAADNLRALTEAVETPMKYPVRGSAKAWVDFNGSGTVAIRDSLNVSSLTDNATGSFTSNYAANMANANYSIGGSTVGHSAYTWLVSGLAAPQVNNCSVVTGRFDTTGGTLSDATYVHTQMFGTLA